MKKPIFTQRRVLTARNLLDQLIDERSVTRIEKKSRLFNESRNGSLAIFANEHIGIRINQFGYYDKAGLDLLFAFLTPLLDELKSGVGLDVGANIGNHSIYFSHFFSTVYSFEPNPRTYDLLSFNSKSVKNIIPMNFGLGDRNGRVKLQEDPDNMGASSISERHGSEHTREVQIEIRRLDDLDLDLSRTNFLKIDVEGFEAKVITGALQLIDARRPLIVMEQHESEFSNTSTESIRLLQAIGYQFCWYQAPFSSHNLVVRRVRAIANVIFRKPFEHKLVTDDSVPPATYGMLIAVPPCFQRLLGIV